MDNSTGLVWEGEFLAQELVLALPVSGFGGDSPSLVNKMPLSPPRWLQEPRSR